jgi:hypothetical protein
MSSSFNLQGHTHQGHTNNFTIKPIARIQKFLGMYEFYYIYLAKVDLEVSRYNLILSHIPRNSNENIKITDYDYIIYEKCDISVSNFIDENFPELIYV